MTEFVGFQKIARLSRNCVITEKIDGTNACVFIGEDGEFLTGSRSRWITPEDDNYGFARWAEAHKDELLTLGPGRHFGEWWGSGCQRGYGLVKGEKRFSLFNTSRWNDRNPPPSCCYIVPVLYNGIFTSTAVDDALTLLREHGSVAAPGFMRPEGVVIYQTAARCYFKKTIENDEGKLQTLLNNQKRSNMEYNATPSIARESVDSTALFGTSLADCNGIEEQSPLIKL